MTQTGRRTLVLLTVVGLLSAPALVLRILCVGNTCEEQAAVRARPPFCSLPEDLRGQIGAGFREGRSADVLAVAGGAPVEGADGHETLPPPWPRVGDEDDGRVPLVFAGAGTDPEAAVPDGTLLTAVAPTVAEAVGLERPHPEVRSGEAVPGVAVGPPARLAVLIVWKGIGSEDLEASPEAWPRLRALMSRSPGTLDAAVGSLPLDPAAVLTTIGTGGLPREHGITGSVVRNDAGRATEAWSRRAPFSVIAALGDDLDEVLGQAPHVGLVGAPLDRGLIGRDWYLETDADDVVAVRTPDRAALAATDLLASGYGADETPDLLGVALSGSLRSLDRATDTIARAADEAAGGEALVIVTATGSGAKEGAVSAETLVRQVERAEGLTDVVEATTTSGLFLDQSVLADRGLGEDTVLRVLRDLRAPDGSPLLADVFSGTAVGFGEFC